MLRRFVTVVLPRALGAEALYSALWVAGLFPALAVRDGLTVLLVSLRGGLSVIELMAAWSLLRRRPGAPLLAAGAVLASAVLLTLETGLRLVPTNLDPTYRWWVVGGYWIYAAAAARWFVRFWLEQQTSEPCHPGTTGTTGTSEPRNPGAG